MVAGVVMLAGTLSVAPLLSETPQAQAAATIRDGVYTTTQAARGKVHYETNCSRCHGADLSGANARPLAGDAFIRDWGGLTLDHFYDRAQTMPPGSASSLADGVYLDIVTYVLAVKEVPAGTAELEAHMLADILIEGEGGPGEAPNFSLVQIVGWLARGPDNDWIVTDASGPVRTRDPAASTGDARSDAEARALATETFNLMYVYPDPAAYEGHRVEAKGFLIRGPQNSVNVTTLASLAPACSSP